MKYNKPIFITKHKNNSALISFTLFWQATREVSKYIDSCLYKSADISSIQMIVLHSIKNNGKMRPAEIARLTNTMRHNISTLIRRMEKAGLITAVRDNKDHRKVNVTITDKGQLVLKKAIPVAEKAVVQVMGSISDSDHQSFQRLLDIMRNNISDG